jgi:hypothetical protein
MNHTEGAIHRSGEQWTPSRSSTLTISVIDKPQKPAPPGARKVPFGFGVRDEPVVEPVAEPGPETLVADEWQGNPS